MEWNHNSQMERFHCIATSEAVFFWRVFLVISTRMECLHNPIACIYVIFRKYTYTHIVIYINMNLEFRGKTKDKWVPGIYIYLFNKTNHIKYIIQIFALLKKTLKARPHKEKNNLPTIDFQTSLLYLRFREGYTLGSSPTPSQYLSSRGGGLLGQGSYPKPTRQERPQKGRVGDLGRSMTGGKTTLPCFFLGGGIARIHTWWVS